MDKFCDWGISQKVSVNGSKWLENTFHFNWDFIKSYNENSDRGYFLEVDVQYPNKLHNFHNDLPFYLKKNKNRKICSQITW